MTTSAAFARHEHAILEGIARGHALHDSLTAIVRLVEEQAGGMFCSILLLDEDGLHVRTGAAPSLPSELMRQFDGQEIGPAAGSCGTAAFRRERVIVDDIATHPYWELYKTAVLPHGLRACWSTPIFDATGDVLGTFAMYYRKVHRPSPEEIAWVDTAANLASIAISRNRTDTLLRRSAAKALRLTRLYAASWIVRDSIIRGEAEVDFADVLCNVLVSSGIVPVALAAPRDSDTPTFAPAMHVVDPGSAANDARQELLENVATNGTSLVTFDKGDRGKPELEAIADRLGVQSFAIVPMHARGKVVGALAVGSNEPAAFEDEEIALIASLADTAATATESHHLHADAARTEAVMSLVYDNIEDVIFYIAVEGVDRYRVLFANRAFEQITGVPVSVVVGRLITEVMPRSSRDIVLEKYRTAIASGEKVTWEYTATYPKGVKIGEVTVCPVFNARGVCTNVVSTVHDVTTRKNAEREREELQSKIVSSQRLQALGTLAGGIAHDFNNVLSVILGYADLVGRELPADGVLAEDVREIQKAATRASDMTRQLLAFSRQQVLEPRVLDPNRAIGDMKRMLERLLGATVELTVDTNAKTANIRVDPTQLEQIVMNLAINARDAMPQGGKLTIVTAGAVLDADYARTHPGATAGRYVMIAVADNGIGMDAATQARIFEPFFTTKERGKGTGLGLATVFGIVKQSGGNIWLQSEPGKGATFKVYLPAVDAAIEDTSARAAPADTSGSETVLLVEDDEQLRELAIEVLRGGGYRVLNAANGDDAIRICQQNDGSIDLLVTDIIMPHMNGRQLAERVSAIRPQMKVVYMSGYTDDPMFHHSSLEPDVHYLQKPITPISLLQKVRTAIDSTGHR